MGQPPSGRPVTRRSVLTGIGATGLATGVGEAGSHPTPTGGGTGTSRPDGSTPVSTPAKYGPLGHVHVEGTKEVVVDPAGETAFVATTSGFAIVDISDPRSPRVLVDRRNLLADRPGGPLREIHDIDYADDRLLVVGPANPVDRAIRAAVLVDVSDPSAPRRLAVYETDYPIHNATLGGEVAYLTGNDFVRNGLVIVDVEAGIERGRWSVADVNSGWLDVDPILWVIHDVTVRNGLAFLAYWDAGTWIVDVSDPRRPQPVARVRGRDPDRLASLSGPAIRREQLEQPGNDHYAATNDDGSLLGLGIEAWDDPDTDLRGGPGGIELWDVSSPSSPRRVSRIAPPTTSDAGFHGIWTTAHNFSFHGNRLYTAWYRGGVRLYDVSDPSTPQLLRAWRDEAHTSFWAARVGQPASHFVASSRENFGPLGSPDNQITGSVYTFPDPPHPPTETATDLPGFGPLVGAAGIGLGAWRALRRAHARR